MTAETVIREAVARGLTVATCESITGGGIGHALTDVPGSSSVFRGGLITYASDLKVALAGVDATMVEELGVVNEPVARAMAEGARSRCGADFAVATTGVAGPTTDSEPVGTVWFAVAGPHGTDAQRVHFEGDRAAVRSSAVTHALLTLIAAIRE